MAGTRNGNLPLIFMTNLQSFGEKLKTLRKQQHLTIYKLGELADVPFTLISALENNRRSIGENNATKIGKALGLEGHQLREFVFLALNDAQGKILEEYHGYPADLLNLLPTILKDAGVEPGDIKSSLLRPDYGDGTVADAVMFLNRRQRAYLSVVIKQE